MKKFQYRDEIFSYILEKYHLPKPLKLAYCAGEIENLNGKTIKSAYALSEELYLFFTDSTVLVLHNASRYGEPEPPEAEYSVNEALVREIIQLTQEKGLDSESYDEMRRLRDQFDEEEELRNERENYERLKRKFEGFHP